MKKTFEYDFKKKEFVIRDGKLQPTNDICVWIEKILRTEKRKAIIYDDEPAYGVQLQDLLVGRVVTNRAFIESEAKREIEDALLQHPDIARVESVKFVGDNILEVEVKLHDGESIARTITI